MACNEQRYPAWGNGTESKVTAQRPPSQIESPNQIPPKSAPVSPYEIEERINEHDESETGLVDFKPVWEVMKIERDEQGIFDGFVPSYSRWHGEVFTAGGSGKQDNLAVLKISADGGADRRYLIFRTNGFDPSGKLMWKFSGYIDVLDNKYEGSPHQKYQRIMSNEKHTWLVLRALANSGTGVFQINEVWHEIEGNNPKRVLEYPIEGHYAQGDVCDRSFSSRLVSQQQVNGVYVVEIQFLVTYGLDHPVFSKRQTASYIWAPDLREFIFDQSKSETSEQELELIYSTGFVKDEVFISVNYGDLERIASHGNQGQKKWLEWILTKVDDVPQRRTLRDKLR
jgi:hypothetical protein